MYFSFVGLYRKSLKASGLRGCSHTDLDHRETYQGTGNYSVLSHVHLKKHQEAQDRKPLLRQGKKKKKDYLESA